MSDNKYTLTVAKVEALTRDSKAIYFNEHPELTTFKAGQFLTLIVSPNDKELRRSYSIFNPVGGLLAVGIKRVPGGIVSNHLNTYLRAGSQVEVQKPAGNFVYDPATEQAKHLILVAGGSGITPMMSILQTALTGTTDTRISLLFVNKSRDDIIFSEQLDDLESKYHDRFTVKHYLDAEHQRTFKKKKAGLMGLFSKGTTHVEPGFINTEKMNEVLDEFAVDKESKAYICGPGGLMTLAEQVFIARGLPKNQVKKENFVPSTEARPAPTFTPTHCNATLSISGQKHEFEITPGKSVLQAAVEADIAIPFSCREGTCTSCYGRCKSGEVGMLTDEALTDEELAESGFLPCVAYPKTKKLVIEMD